jgi:hypothetical protein
MATLGSTRGTDAPVIDGSPSAFATDPRKYQALGDFLTQNGDFNKPDVRDLLVKTYGDQGITGFLQLTGAVNSGGSADQVEWFEEGRRHVKLVVETGASFSSASSADSLSVDPVSTVEQTPNKYDVLMHAESGNKFIVDTVASDRSTFNISTLDGESITVTISANDEFIILGNMHPQGSNQPETFLETEPERRKNPYMIVKDRYEVNGSQATNIGYVNIGNGDYRWFMHGEQEARKRFMDRREMMLLFGEINDGGGALSDVAGSEGYFSALEARGMQVTGTGADPLNSFTEFDTILVELDKQGAPAEYAMYLNRTQSLAIDDMLAAGIGTQLTAGLPGQFGAFNNDADMAVQLGFKSFTRGGYTFHKHDWKLLNDPTLLGGVTTGGYTGAMVPLANIADARTGVKAPALELCYKEANGYSREMEHWVTGGGVLGHNNNGGDGKDVATFHYRSEIALVTRAANQHVLLKY